MPTYNRRCVFDPTTNNIVDLLRPNESDAEALIRLASYGLDLIVLPHDEAWKRHENAAERPVPDVACSSAPVPRIGAPAPAGASRPSFTLHIGTAGPRVPQRA